MVSKSKKSKDYINSVLNKKCGGKVKRMDTGGLFSSFNYNSLSESDKAAYDKLTPEQQAQVRTQYDAQGNNTGVTQTGENLGSNQGDTSTLGNAGVIGSLIATIAGVVDSAAGDVDPETGQSETEAQAALQGVANSASGANIATGLEQLGEAEDFEDYALSALNVLSPGAGELINQEKYQDEYNRKKKENTLKSAYYQKRKAESFKDGGVTEEEPVPISDSISNYLKTSEQIEPLIAKDIFTQTQKERKIALSDDYIEKPYGTDPKTGKTLTRIEKKQESQTAKLIHKDWKPQTVDNTKQILNLFYGGDEQYDPNDPESLKKIISQEKRPLGSTKEGFTDDDVFEVTKDSTGKYVLQRNTLDRRTTETIPSKSKGGEITGPGTGKSDSIKAEIPIGSYIIPADAPKSVTNRLKKYMNYDDTDLKSEEGRRVNVSDGEIYIPPQDVPKANSFVKRLGYKNGLDDMAPNAETKLGDNPNMAEGGLFGELVDNAGTVGGTAQILYGLIDAHNNDKPKSNTKELLSNLSNEVRLRAAYGMNPYERTQSEKAIERNLNDERKVIQNVGAGDISLIMNNIAAATIRANNARLSLETTSSKMKEDKERYADEITMKSILANEKNFERDYNEYIAKEEGVSEMISAGIGNIIGQNRFNKAAEVYKSENNQTNNQTKSIGKDLIDEAIKGTEKQNNDPVIDIVNPESDWFKNIIT
jgi:hypothetical protein